MRYLLLSLIMLLEMISLLPAHALQGSKTSAEAALNKVEAIQAMAIANEWKWTKKEVKSYVTSQEVVFEFSNGKVKRIPLPEEKMLIAVAPYVRRTHS